MNINELLTEFPLVEKEKEYFDSTFSIMKEVLPKVVSQQMNMELPEKVVSEICSCDILIKNYTISISLVVIALVE